MIQSSVTDIQHTLILYVLYHSGFICMNTDNQVYMDINTYMYTQYTDGLYEQNEIVNTLKKKATLLNNNIHKLTIYYRNSRLTQSLTLYKCIHAWVYKLNCYFIVLVQIYTENVVKRNLTTFIKHIYLLKVFSSKD